MLAVGRFDFKKQPWTHVRLVDGVETRTLRSAQKQ